MFQIPCRSISCSSTKHGYSNWRQRGATIADFCVSITPVEDYQLPPEAYQHEMEREEMRRQLEQERREREEERKEREKEQKQIANLTSLVTEFLKKKTQMHKSSIHHDGAMYSTGGTNTH
ncbi:stress response protein NST1-like isoform X2 [Phoenix dactylifera]|uniref:Stress response protein NST1-like isoform X2 n=1 Tax=Phoenix dactylifera TaxID=42345 RepID=A0A8B9AR57_PHODC|nr:stress response protein NST1-like isoform X2 [Phoenix dactylifera]